MLKKYFRCWRRGRGWTGTSRFLSNFYRIFPRIAKHMKDLFFTFVTMKEDIHELTYRLADSGGVKKSTFIILGTFFRIAYVVVFFYLSYANYVALRSTQKFVSLSLTSGDCSFVPKTISLVNLKGSYDGKWDTDREYVHSNSMYSFALNNFEADFDQYDKWMQTIHAEIDSVGKLAETQTLPENLLYWSFWNKDIAVPGGLSAQDEHIFSFNGDPRVFANGGQLHGSISDLYNDCPGNLSSKTYDLDTGKFALEFSMNDFRNSGKCNAIMDPSLFGYSSYTSRDTFKITVDFISALSAISANNGIVTVKDMVFLSRYESVAYNGVEFAINAMYYEEYATSDPVYCFGPVGDVSQESWICLLKVGDSFGFPFFEHFGTSEVEPDICSCNSPSGLSDSCNTFDFITGIFFYDWKSQKTSSPRPIIPFLELFFGSNKISMDTASKSVFNASWLSATEHQSNPQTRQTYHDNVAFRTYAYKFSNTSYGPASILTFRSFSKYNYSAVNIEGFRVPKGSCANSFTSSNFQNLIDKPWGDIVEPYYECTYFAGDAFLIGVGIASGTVSTFLPTIVFLVMFAFIFPNVLKGVRYDHKSNERIENFEYSLNAHDTAAMNLMAKLTNTDMLAKVNVLEDGHLKYEEMKKKKASVNHKVGGVPADHLRDLLNKASIPAPELQAKSSAGPLSKSNNIASDIQSGREFPSSITEKDPNNPLLVEEFEDEEDFEAHSAPKKVDTPTKSKVLKYSKVYVEPDIDELGDDDDVEAGAKTQKVVNSPEETMEILLADFKAAMTKIKDSEVLLKQLSADIVTNKETILRIENQIKLLRTEE